MRWGRERRVEKGKKGGGVVGNVGQDERKKGGDLRLFLGEGSGFLEVGGWRKMAVVARGKEGLFFEKTRSKDYFGGGGGIGERSMCSGGIDSKKIRRFCLKSPNRIYGEGV